MNCSLICYLTQMCIVASHLYEQFVWVAFWFLFALLPPARMLRAGVVFGGVCVPVCLSARNLENYWSEIDVTW